MRTRIHYYSFDVRKPAEATAYNAMLARIAENAPAARGKMMHSHGGARFEIYAAKAGSRRVTIETAHLFDNQWNTTTDRVFDHYLEYISVNGRENRNIKRGHWLEITKKMAQARQDTKRCGFCGELYGPLHAAEPAGGFCTACLDSPYLEESQLHLLRLLPLIDGRGRDLLSDAEHATMLPLYVKRQTTGAASRAAAKRKTQRARIISDADEMIDAAGERRDGMLWLLDHGLSIENVIYYKHTREFCFGWKNFVGPAVVSALLEVISEFQYTYKIKCEDGRELSGN